MLSKVAGGDVPRRGRPRNMERRRVVAREAIAAFAEHGYDGCTMADIAARCGLSRTLLTRYFPRKVLVLEEAVEYANQRIAAAHEALGRSAARAASLRDFLIAAGTIQLHHLDELAAWYAVWIGGIPLDAAQRSRLRAAEESLYAVVAGFVGSHGDSGDPYVFARTFLGALQSLVLMQSRAAFEPATAELRGVFLDELVELLLRGVPERGHH